MAILAAQRTVHRVALFAVCCLLVTYLLLDRAQVPGRVSWGYVPSSFDWANRVPRYPIAESSITRLPQGRPRELPRLQHDFSQEQWTEAHNKTQRERRDAVREAAVKSWNAYREYALGRDELTPVSLGGKDSFNGWGATLVDSLDTLWIMELKREFKEAVRLVARIDWDKGNSRFCSLFETNIRYLGGLLAAYDLSQEVILLDKAVELGDMLYSAFDTPNRLPASRLNFAAVKEGLLYAGKKESSAAIGSLSLEFTRLSQLTGNPKYYGAVDNIKKHFERTQDDSKLPGMWPVFVDAKNGFLVTDNTFGIAASADSAYEYLAKTYALLGGLDQSYKKMHLKAMATIKKHLLFRPMLPDAYPATAPDILFPGTVLSNGRIVELLPEVHHLGCFAGAMFALGGKLFHQDDDVRIGEQLARGCAWAYEAFPTGIMPEMAEMVPCPAGGDHVDSPKTAGEKGGGPCAWNETYWKEKGPSEQGSRKRKKALPIPYSAVRDPQYLLRPEAVESLFVLYRITGKRDLLDAAWRMFSSIRKATETKAGAFSSITDVATEGYTTKIDSMESYWIAETLKYFYLLFSEPDLISLDDFVFNTEAHPLRVPKDGI